MRIVRSIAGALCLFALLGCGSNTGGAKEQVGSGGFTVGSGGKSGSGGSVGAGGSGTGGVTHAGGGSGGGVSGTGGDSGTGGHATGGSNGQGGGPGGSSAGSTGGATGQGGSTANTAGATGQGLGGSSAGGAGGTLAGGTGGVMGGGGGSTGKGGTTGAGGGTGPVSHRFLKSGCNSSSVAIVAANGTVEWEYPITDETSDSWLLPNGNVVFSFSKGVREVTPAKITVWEYLVPSGCEAHACQPLPGDQFLIGEAHGDGTSYLYEMGRDKKITKTIPIKVTGAAHDQFRQVRKTPAGTYIVTFQRTGGQAQEYDGTGKLLRSFPCGRFVGIRLPDGNTLIACGDDHRIIEVDAADKIVWEVKETDIPNNKLLFVAGLQRLANGNTVVANWGGHVGSIAAPQVFEITRDKKVVWEVKDAKLNYVSSINILDSDALVEGEALR